MELEAYLRDLLTKKMKADKITIMEVTTSDDSSTYKVNAKVEHPAALIAVADGQPGYIQVVSNDASVSNIDKAGGEATYVTSLDFVNRLVNGQ